MPRLSIITVNLNNAKGLHKTLNSVFEQSFKDYEYIIIDGGSKDASKELIEKYADKINYSVSEKDSGIYNAMNKAIQKSNGEYLLFLNSGDHLADKNILTEMFSRSTGSDIIYGNLLLDDGSKLVEASFPKKLLFSYFFHGSLPHASSLIRKSLFEKTGLYNEQHVIVSDWEFFLLAINKFQCTYQYIPIAVTIFNLEGISARKENQQLIQAERQAVLKKHFASFLPEYEAHQKLQSEIPEVKSMLGYRLHVKVKNISRKFFKS